MAPTRPRVVFDCNVLVQAVTRENGPAAAALRLVDQSQITLHISKAILRELRQTLEYAEIRERNPHLSSQLIREFVARLLFRGVLRREVPRVFSYPRDPGDEPYIDLAVAVQADFLVTRDRDLLALRTDHSIIGKELRQRLPSLRIVEPPEFLDALGIRYPSPPTDH
jgi:putative PIN family toxin of toxin-antitoxin system